MKIFKVFAAALILVVSAGCMKSEVTENPPMPKGTLRLASQPDGSGMSCGLPFETGNYNLNNSDPYYCRRDRLNYFQVDNAPSATTFKLEDDFCNDSSSQWEFELRTIKHPTTTRWISIAELKSKEEGDIVVPGVRLEKKMVKGGDQIDELSCVRVVRSALP